MTDSWDNLLSETSRSFHDYFSSPEGHGTLMLVVGGWALAEEAAAIIALPEIITLVTVWEVASISVAMAVAVDKLVIGSSELILGNDLKSLVDDSPKVFQRIETIDQVREALKGDGIKQLKAVYELTEKLEKFVPEGSNGPLDSFRGDLEIRTDPEDKVRPQDVNHEGSSFARTVPGDDGASGNV